MPHVKKIIKYLIWKLSLVEKKGLEGKGMAAPLFCTFPISKVTIYFEFSCMWHFLIDEKVEFIL